MSLVDKIKKAVKVGALVGLMGVLGAEGAYYYNTTAEQRAQHAEVVRTVARKGYEKSLNVVKGGYNLTRNYLGSAVDGKYDNHNLFCDDSLESLLEPTHKINSTVQFELVSYSYDTEGKRHEKVRRISRSGHGSGIVVDNNGERLKILTCDHVVPTPRKTRWYDGKKRLVREIRNLKQRYVLEQFSLNLPIALPPVFGSANFSFGLELDVAARDQRSDLALLETRLKDIKRIKGYKAFKRWGNSDELKPGDFLYAVGYPFGLSKQVTDGRVASEVDKRRLIYFSSACINPGNSGGPVYALRDGRPEFVGISQKTWYNGISGMIRGDVIKAFLEKIGLGFVYRGGKR
ncbi:serine protease [Candidatus Woesearchaeota archaeon]|nr:serine protease [Candidatus Woesearchaeota archaeon]